MKGSNTSVEVGILNNFLIECGSFMFGKITLDNEEVCCVKLSPVKAEHLLKQISLFFVKSF